VTVGNLKTLRSLAAAAIAVATLLIGAGPVDAAVPRFSAKLVGNSATGRVAKHAFVVGDGYTGVFRDNRRARTPYRVCCYRGQVRAGCKVGRTGRVGRDDAVFLVAPSVTGQYEYRWIVAGRAVVRWVVVIGVGD
jgi:hypothetical protein